MLVGNQINHHQCDECVVVPHRIDGHGRVRDTKCLTHDVVVGPSGWEYGHYGGYKSGAEDGQYAREEREYVVENLYRFLCRYIYSFLDDLPLSGYNMSRESSRKLRTSRIYEYKKNRLNVCNKENELFQIYAYLSGVDLESLIKKIRSHNATF